MSKRRVDNVAIGLLRRSSTRRSAVRPLCGSNSTTSRSFSSLHINKTFREYGRLSCTSTQCGRAYSTEAEGSRIAIAGGGLTGLTTAYYLAKELPSSTKITLYESSDRLGGWVRTDRVPVHVDGVKGTVSFERGPRTLSSLNTSTWRYDDLILYDLALDLGLKIATPPDQPRFIYYPDHLVPMPPASSLLEFIQEPIFMESLWAGFGFLWRRLRSNEVPIDDMSISDWIHEISGSRTIADNFASAMIHGIYGGSIHKLSARSVLDRVYWAYYMPKMGNMIKQMPLVEQQLMSKLSEDPEIKKMALKKKGSLLHFGEAGMESLTTALADALNGQPNVEIKLGEGVSKLRYSESGEKVELTTSSKQQRQYHKVISTLPSQHLASIVGGKLPSLEKSFATSIMTVNVWYPQKNLKPPGFGYLIPQSVPPEQNPERALGVFFDSDVGVRGPDEPEGTKLFVLMGGHYYDEAGTAPPSEDVAIEQAKAVLERHLGILRSTPCFAMARYAKECIPQHFVGHQEAMESADEELREGFGGRLAVAGGSYARIGAMGAVRNGYDIAQKLKAGGGKDGWLCTGLENMEFPPKFVAVPLPRIPVRRFKQLGQ